MFVVSLILCAVSFALSLWTVGRVIHWAPRIGLVDRPGGRKQHGRVIPLGGGLAVFAATMTTLLGVVCVAGLVQSFPSLQGVVPGVVGVHASGVMSKAGLLGLIALAAAVQMLLGLADDWRAGGLGYQLRLGVEVLLVGVLMWQGVRLSLFTDSIWVTGPITVLWIVGLTNALNFLDNMDGLCGGVSLITAAFFAAIAALVGNLFIAGCFFVLVGALAGFLRYNWNPAKVFLGDAGSNFLGFWIGVLTVVATYTGEGLSHVTIFAPLCVLAVPIYDSTTVIALRLIQGKSPFQPDRQHFSHRLVELGFQPKYAVLLIYLVTITTGLGGVLLYFVPASAAWLVLAQVGCILGVIALLELAAYRRTRSSAAPEREGA
jgi:UDP-GlcNAc:undecaprenyl-phosphate GlcNAc-1-phosphate transferase